LGGYDQARVAGDFKSFEVDPELKSPFLQVKGLDWKESDQDTVNLMPDYTEYIWALPEPYSSWLQVPEDTYNKFVEAANSSGDVVYNSTTNSYQYYSIPDGEFVITLNNGMKTTIPAQDLLFHPWDYNDDGSIQVLNNSYYEALLWWANDPNSALSLGQPFMKQKLFVADWDAGKFYMADAMKDKQVATNIQSLCAPTTGVPPPPPPPPHPDPGPNVAAIAGGVIGGVGGLAAIVLIVWFVRRKKKATQQAVPEVSEPSDRTSSLPPKYAVASAYPASEPSVRYRSPPPQEMASPPQSPTPQMASYAQSKTTSEGSSSGYWSHQPVGPTNYVQNGISSVSGPLEMPTNYDERSSISKY